MLYRNVEELQEQNQKLLRVVRVCGGGSSGAGGWGRGGGGI